MSAGLGFVLFAVALGFSVAVHEFGHLLTAKAFGMKARRYFIGFGPKIFSFHKGETEYGLKAIPAGGFVDIAGFTHLEEIEPTDEPRAFYNFATWKRFTVLVAGSLTHFLIAFLVLFLCAVAVGLPTDRPVIGAVTSCVLKSDPQNTADVNCASPGKKGVIAGAAKKAGLQQGDRVLSVNGVKVADPDALVTRIRDAPGQRVRMGIIRDGKRLTIPVDVPGVTRGAINAAEKKRARGTVLTVGTIGVSIGTGTETFGPITSIGKSADFMGNGIVATFKGIGSLPGKVPAVFAALGGKKRDANGPVSVVGVSRIGGQAVAAGSWLTFLLLLASFNLFIGIFNLFPLLPLDGGHVAILLYERVRTWLAKVRRRAPPTPVDLQKLMPVTLLVIAVVGGISVVTILADVVNPISNPFR
ncbi:MAG: M50 family metallopeptidase [Mycobacteriales bacterium]